jgi:hypothetical protein
VGAYSGAQVKWYLASVLPVSSTATDTATSTLDIAQVSAGQETIYRDGMGAEIPPGPDRVYNRLVLTMNTLPRPMPCWLSIRGY